jgi:hypothetical protein
MKHLKPSLACCLLSAMAAGLLAVPAVFADNVKTELDCAANSRILHTHFGPYGYYPKTCVMRQSKGVRFWLPADEGVEQTGLYSYAALAGDFEVSALYDWDNVPAPQKGYGASCGIAVEALGSGATLSLARGHLIGKGQGQGYVVTRGEPGEKGVRYELAHFSPTRAKSGRLLLRREKTELVCLAADDIRSEPRELCRIPFTDATVRPVRLFADTGGSPTGLDARLSMILLRGDEVATGLVKHDQGGGMGWWLAGGGVIIAAAVLVIRRMRAD